MPEPVRAHGEFDGHERPLREVEELQDDLEGVDRLRLGPRGHLEAHGPQDVLDHLVPDEPRKEVVDDRPLIMPPDDPTSLVEPFLGRERRERRGVDHAVVVLEKSEREPRDDQILVIASVPEERAPFPVAGQVLFAHLVLPDQEVDAVVSVEEGLVVGPATVDRIEVEPGRAEVDQGLRVVVALQLRRRVEREVVVHELAEVREARGDVRVVARRVVLARLRLRLDHLPCERVERFVARQEWRQVAEHPPEAALEEGRSEDGHEAPRLDAMERVEGHVTAWGRPQLSHRT